MAELEVRDNDTWQQPSPNGGAGALPYLRYGPHPLGEGPTDQAVCAESLRYSSTVSMIP
jgi:hypothetical protein